MRKSLFPADDSLPTWLHTLACFLVVSLFGTPLIWWGSEAIHFRHLEPVTGPEIGQYFFGSAALEGKAAVWAGWSLIMLGAAFFALGARYTRAGRDSAALRLLPWALTRPSRKKETYYYIRSGGRCMARYSCWKRVRSYPKRTHRDLAWIVSRTEAGGS